MKRTNEQIGVYFYKLIIPNKSLTIGYIFIFGYELVDDVLPEGRKGHHFRIQHTIFVEHIHQHVEANRTEGTKYERKEKKEQMCTYK